MRICAIAKLLLVIKERSFDFRLGQAVYINLLRFA